MAFLTRLLQLFPLIANKLFFVLSKEEGRKDARKLGRLVQIPSLKGQKQNVSASSRDTKVKIVPLLKKFVKFIYPRIHLQVHENIRANIHWTTGTKHVTYEEDTGQQDQIQLSVLLEQTLLPPLPSEGGPQGPMTALFLLPVGRKADWLPSHPPDAYLQDRAVVKVVGAGSPFQGGKGHVASSERGNVTEFICAQGLLLVLSCPDEASVCLQIGVLAGATVILVRHPGPVLPCALVNGEALWPARVEFEAHIRDVKSFSCGTNTSQGVSHTYEVKKSPVFPVCFGA